MKVLFLDIDGVMSTASEKVLEDGFKDFKTQSINNLNYLMDLEPDLSIVLSSSWRKYYTLDELKKIFLDRDFAYTDRILDTTPVIKTKEELFAPRGFEIEQWIFSHIKTTRESITDRKLKIDESFKYAIVDDEEDMLFSQRNNFVKTDPKKGFDFEHVVSICSIIKSA